MNRISNDKTAYKVEPGIVTPNQFSPVIGSDPYFSSVGNLLHFDNSNFDQKYGDTAGDGGSGNTFDAVTFKFGPTSKRYSGAGFSYLNSGFPYNVGAEEMTAECWAYIYAAQTVNAGLIGYTTNAAVNSWQILFGAGANNALLLVQCKGGTDFTANAALTTGLWYHIALTRNSSGVVNLWINGVKQTNSTTSTANWDVTVSQGYFLIGVERTLAIAMKGNVDDLRFTRLCRYTANFTPPTAPFPNF